MASRLRMYAPIDGVGYVGYMLDSETSYTYAEPRGTSTPCIDRSGFTDERVDITAILEPGYRFVQWVVTAFGQTFYYDKLDGGISWEGYGSADVHVRLEVEKIQTYTISAYVSFDANGGSVSPSYDYNEKETTTSYGYVDITFPMPTRSGYTFLYWLLDGYATHYGAGTHSIYASADGETYTARAQWEEAGTGKAYIGDGGVWKQAVPYIGDGGVWKPATENIGDGGVWK